MNRPAFGVYFFLHGVFSLLVQVVLLREIAFLCGGYEISVALALCAWLFWVGKGSFRADGPASAERLAGWAALAVPLIPVLVALTRILKSWLPFGELPGLFSILLIAVLVPAPPGFLLGRMFALGCSLAGRERVPKLYVFEALGAVAAGLLYAFVLSGRVPPLAIVSWSGAAVLGGAALLTGPPPLKGYKTRWVLFMTGVIVLVLAGNPLLEVFSRKTQWTRYELLASRDTPYGHLAVGKLGTLFTFFEDGAVSAVFPDEAFEEELVHWALLSHPEPRRVMLTGSGAAVRLAQVLKHPVERADWVEPDPWVAALLAPFLPPQDSRALSDARVFRAWEDPRRWLRSHPASYDAIVQAVPEPQNARLNRFFTREFYEEARAALRPGGVLAFSIPSAENYLSPETLYLDASLVKTVRAVFPFVRLIPGDRLTLVAHRESGAAPASATDAAALWTARYRQRHISNRVVVPSGFPHFLDPGRAARTEENLKGVAGVKPNSDFHPVSYFHLWRVWLSKFVSPSHFVGLAGLLLLAGLSLRGVWRAKGAWLRFRPAAGVAALGFGSMTVEVVLLFAFQAVSGALYWQMGILFASFMAGLAAGGGAGHFFSQGSAPSRRLFSLSLGGSLAMSLLLAWKIESLARFSGMPPIPLFAGLLFAQGFLVGTAFAPAVALLREFPSLRWEAGSIYALDLWGSSAGGMLTASVSVPLWGFSKALLIGAAPIMIGILILALRPRPAGGGRLS